MPAPTMSRTRPEARTAMATRPGPHPGAAQGWPSGPLDAAQKAFDLLTCAPAPLAFDCRGFAALPQRILALDELQRLLASPGFPSSPRDQVWSHLVVRARRDGPAWVVAAVGVALPALRWRAGHLARGWRGDTADLDSELLLGFLEKLKSIDAEAGNIAARLVEAGARAVRNGRRHGEPAEIITVRAPGSAPPARPYDHPDLVLARAVAAGIIGPEEGTLIASTRLEDIALHEVADHLGITLDRARAWRYRAEIALRDAINAGELMWIGAPPASTRTRHHPPHPRTSGTTATT